MKKVFVNELENYSEKEVSISGFVDVVRDKKWVMFVILKDSTGKVQVTLEKSEEKNNEMIETFAKITKDSVVKVSGKVMKNEAVKLGGLEIIPSSVEVLSKAEELPYDYNNLEGVNSTFAPECSIAGSPI
jgi:aspartyl-tRNA synthetase